MLLKDLKHKTSGVHGDTRVVVMVEQEDGSIKPTEITSIAVQEDGNVLLWVDDPFEEQE